MSRLNLHLFGPPRLEFDGLPVEIERRKALALLAYLAVTRQRHTRATLAALLWPETVHTRAHANLRLILWELNHAVDDGWIDASRDTVSLNLDADLWLDVTQFRLLLTKLGKSDPDCAVCVPLLTQAAALYRDHFLAGFSLKEAPGFDEWVFFEAEGLRRDLARSLEMLVHCLCEQGQAEAAIAHARRLVALDPLDEETHRQLMGLYGQAGQHKAALRQYQECVRIVRDELGVEPQPQTTELYEKLKADGKRPKDSAAPIVTPRARSKVPGQLASLNGREEPIAELALRLAPEHSGNGTSALPVELKARVPAHNLPSPSTAFIGRESELVQIADRLADPGCRLLTVVGPGGIGKTRLALQAAAGRLEAFADGVFFVTLTPVGSTSLIASAIAGAVQYSFNGQEDPNTQVIDYLRARRMLLLLDNFEHLLAGVDLVSEILQAALRVKILVTSRERLNIEGETIFRLEGMDFPDSEAPDDAAEYSAVKLFLQSARRVQPDFALDEDNLKSVARICESVQGMPLGILLAAAWVEALALPEIAQEIEKSLDFLETEQRDLPARHRSLRAAFDCSWNLLTDAEREAFKNMSVFRGGFTREAAQHVADASLKTLRMLVNKSLLRRDASTGRYDMHELLRQYGEQQLDALPQANATVRKRHSEYYAGFLAQHAARLDDIEVEYANAHAAWNQMIQTRSVAGIDKEHEGLRFFLDGRGRHREALELVNQAEQALRLMSPDRQTTLVIGHLLIDKGWLFVELGLLDEAKTSIQEGLAILRESGETTAISSALQNLSYAYTFRSEFTAGRQAAEEALHIARSSNDRNAVIRSLFWLGAAFMLGGHPAEARLVAQECLKLALEAGDAYTAANASYIQLAAIAGALGNYAEAKQRFAEGCRYYAGGGYYVWAALAYRGLGQVALASGEHEGARHCYRESLILFVKVHQTWEVLETLCNMVELLIAQSRKPEAVELLSLIQNHPARRRAANPLEPRPRSYLYVAEDDPERLFAQLQRELPPEVYAAAVENGTAFDLDTVVAAILAE